MTLPTPFPPPSPTTSPAATAPAAPPSPEHLHAWLVWLEHGLLERDTAVRLVLLAALAQEHVLLLGPPGTAKSELARRLHRVFGPAQYFERLLTRFSTPEELFGPLSLRALEDDRYERLTQGFLPTASLAFLDEVFKANSAILNALLTLLNEREFDNGSGRQATPLISVVAASNEPPQDESLQAFHDRFLIRLPITPVSDAQFEALLRLPRSTGLQQTMPPMPPALNAPACAALRAQSESVRFEDDVIQGLQQLRQWLAAQHLHLSDRRWRQWIGLMQVAAASEGRTHLDRWDLWLLPYVVSPSPEHVAPLLDWFEHTVAGTATPSAQWLTHAVEAFEQQLHLEETTEAPGADDSAGKLALARAIQGPDSNAATSSSADMMRLVSATLEAQRRQRYTAAHIAARLQQVAELIAPTQDHQAALQQQLDALRSTFAQRLWLPPSLQARLLHGPTQGLHTVTVLLERLQAVHAGFQALPQQDDVAGAPDPAAQAQEAPPAPVHLPPTPAATAWLD